MPAGRFSRYLLCETLMDIEGRLYLGDRKRFTYKELSDNRYHQVVEGDTLFGLAAMYFEGTERPAGLYWVIADFQPTPIYDATLALDLGHTLVIPSMRVVMEQILNSSRRREFRG